MTGRGGSHALTRLATETKVEIGRRRDFAPNALFELLVQRYPLGSGEPFGLVRIPHTRCPTVLSHIADKADPFPLPARAKKSGARGSATTWPKGSARVAELCTPPKPTHCSVHSPATCKTPHEKLPSALGSILRFGN